MVRQSIIDLLTPITREEQAILDGRESIDRTLYMGEQADRINSAKLLSAGKLITLRPHTRFIHFPCHSHDYIEVVYVCRGCVDHVVNGQPLSLKEGELLFLGQSATHEVLRTGERDLAVNFIVLPEFFSDTLDLIREEATQLRQFLVDCLFDRATGPGYLYFQVAQDVPIQNLIENLLFALLFDTPNRHRVSRMTMSLLFLQLLDHTDRLAWTDGGDRVLDLLRYIEERYPQATLTEAACLLDTDICTLSRLTKRHTGKTFTRLVQEKRLSQAAFLLRSTDRNVDDISVSVGYENISYFHRIFRAAYGCSPRQYRVK